MKAKIGEVKGYTIFYDPYERDFILYDKDNNEVGRGGTQDEVEAQADKLAKVRFSFPIAAIAEDEGSFVGGKITSINLGHKSCQFVPVGKQGRRTMHLQWRTLYEMTPHNKALLAEAEKLSKQIEELKGKRSALKAKMEKPINLAYFGMKSGY